MTTSPSCTRRGSGSVTGIATRFGGDEVAACWYCERALTPRRLRIRQLARALLVYPGHLPYEVAAAIADSG